MTILQADTYRQFDDFSNKVTNIEYQSKSSVSIFFTDDTRVLLSSEDRILEFKWTLSFE